MRLFTLWIALILFSSSVSAADTYALAGKHEPAGILQLPEALKFAFDANPDIAVAMREREAMEGVRIQAGVRPNPSISTSVETTRNSAQKTAILLNQPFELGNKRSARLGAADARFEAATAAVKAKQADIQASVQVAFFEVLAAQERLKLATASLNIATQAREAAAKRVQAGKISPVEETKSRVAESAVKIDVTQAQAALSAARMRLAALMGETLPRFGSVEGDLERLPHLNSLESHANLVDQAPMIKVARLEIETREALAGIENSRRIPDVTVSVGAQRNDELGINQALLGLTVPIPVFDRNQGNMQEARTRVNKARDELTALRFKLDAALASQFEQLRAAIEAARTLQTEIVPGAESAFDAASKGFIYGKFSYLEVLDAQRTLFQARTRYLNTLLEAHQADAEIKRLVGDGTYSSEQTIVPNSQE